MKAITDSPHFSIRALLSSDIPTAMELKEFAGWNQTPEDWRLFLRLAPEGCFAGTWRGRVVATATAVSYEKRIGWIGMILVHPDHRRQGMATAMMKQAIRYLEAAGCRTLGLDATEAGALVYRKLGFRAAYRVERWIRAPGPFTASGDGAEPVTPRDVDRLATWDRRAFGASRANLLTTYLEMDRPAYKIEGPRGLEGFAFGRAGSRAFQVGPLRARQKEVGGRLLDHFVSERGGQDMIADLAARNEARSLLRERDFRVDRKLLRMTRGDSCPTGPLEEPHLLAGFAIG